VIIYSSTVRSLWRFGIVSWGKSNWPGLCLGTSPVSLSLGGYPKSRRNVGPCGIWFALQLAGVFGLKETRGFLKDVLSQL